MPNKYNISINNEVDFLLKKLAEMVGESRASVVSNLIYEASQDEDKFITMFRKIKLARLGINHPGTEQKSKQ